MEVSYKVKKIFSDVLEVSIEQINDEISTNNTSSWDSFNMIKLVVKLEEEFSISIGIEEVITIKSFANMLDLIKNKIN